MITLSQALLHYKRPEIQKAIVDSCKNREVATRFGEGFGKRPDSLFYPNDILELVKNGATSFHVSEELWKNPLSLSTDMKKKEIEQLRMGWDLIIDIDFEEWNSTKLIAHEIITALKKHNISSISCKFSGNKGFHIGVPFEAFPKKITINNQKTEIKNLFPEGVQRIVKYLMYYIDNHTNNFALSKKIIALKEFQEYLQKNKISLSSISNNVCSECGTPQPKKESQLKIEFICPKCSTNIIKNQETHFLKCPKCNIFMDKFKTENKTHCPKCKSNKFTQKIDLKIDTLLISSRHLFRSLYSLHEKSGLASIPLDPNKVLEFQKESANPQTIKINQHEFLNREQIQENPTSRLIIQAFDYQPTTYQQAETKSKSNYQQLGFAVPKELFPPCIKKGLQGLEDGRKRFLFLLINFLTSVGWNYPEIKALLEKWNNNNPEKLREVLIKGQLRYHKTQKKKILPPNCDNKAYYQELGICTPDSTCQKAKNPVNYSRRKALYLNKTKKKSKKPSKN